MLRIKLSISLCLLLPLSQEHFILGKVTDAGTNAPVAGAIVQVIRQGASSVDAGDRAAVQRSVTDANGRFLFRGLTASRYLIEARAAGFLPLRPSARVDLTSGQPGFPLAISLVRLGSVSGSVVDESGEPLAGVLVRVLAPGRSMVGTPGLFARTDDQGRYQVANVPPGDYVVGSISTTVARLPGTVQKTTAATPFLNMGNVLLEVPGEFTALTAPVGLRIDGQSVSVAPTTFYRSARVPDEAELVTVGPGEDLTGIDLTCIRQQTVRLVGQLFGQQTPAAATAVRLVPRGVDDGLSEVPLDAARTLTDSTGRFAFAGVPPGDYTLSAESGAANTVEAGAPPLEFLRHPLSVGSADVEGLVLNLQPALLVTGRVEFLDPGTRPGGGARFSLRGIKQQRMGVSITERSAAADASGAVRLDGLLPGTYAFSAGLPAGWQVQDMFIDGREHKGGPVTLSADARIRIVAVRSLPTLTVTLTQQSGVEVSAMVAVIFPVAPGAWNHAGFGTRRARSEWIDARAQVQFGNLPVGEYFVAVLPRDRLAANWQAPGRLKELAASAQRVQLRSSMSVVVTAQARVNR